MSHNTIASLQYNDDMASINRCFSDGAQIRNVCFASLWFVDEATPAVADLYRPERERERVVLCCVVCMCVCFDVGVLM